MVKTLQFRFRAPDNDENAQGKEKCSNSHNGYDNDRWFDIVKEMTLKEGQETKQSKLYCEGMTSKMIGNIRMMIKAASSMFDTKRRTIVLGSCSVISYPVKNPHIVSLFPLRRFSCRYMMNTVMNGKKEFHFPD